MEENQVRTPEKKSVKRNRIIIIITSSVAALALATLIIWVSFLNAKVTEVQSGYNDLSDSVKKVTTLVKDTIYPVLVAQQSYVQQFKDSFVSNAMLDEKLAGNKKYVTSYVNSHLGKVTKVLESVKSNQTSFVDVFNNELKRVKNIQDSLAKLAKVDPLLNLPVITVDKKISQSNGGKGGQKKLRFNRILKSKAGETQKPGW